MTHSTLLLIFNIVITILFLAFNYCILALHFSGNYPHMNFTFMYSMDLVFLLIVFLLWILYFKTK
jgi:hypothetical protein